MRSNMAVSEALENEHRASQRSSEECSQIVFSVFCTLSCLVGAAGHLDEPIDLKLARQMGNALDHALWCPCPQVDTRCTC